MTTGLVQLMNLILSYQQAGGTVVTFIAPLADFNTRRLARFMIPEFLWLNAYRQGAHLLPRNNPGV